MRIAYIAIALAAAMPSCERDTVVDHTADMPRIYRCSAFVARSENGACYEILVAGSPQKVKWAIYGDGRHDIEGSSADGVYQMRDHQNGESWEAKLGDQGQYLIRPDRSVVAIGDFASVRDDGIHFSETEEPILKRVVEAFRKRYKSEQVSGGNGE